jgi:hypothetical protein
MTATGSFQSVCFRGLRASLVIGAVLSLTYVQQSAAQVEAIYWAEHELVGEEVEWTIRRADPDGQNVTTVYELLDESESGMVGPLGPVVASSRLNALFFAEIHHQHNLSIVRTGTDGELPTSVFSYTAPFTGLEALRVLAGRRQIAYVEDTVSDGLLHTIQFVSIDTGDRRPNLNLPMWVFDFVIDDRSQRLYWARPAGIDTHAVGIYTSDLSGSGIELLVEHSAHALALDPRQNKIYWSHPADGIFRSSLNGRDVEHLVAGAALEIATDVDDGILYWLHRDTHTIYRATAEDLLSNGGSSAEAIYVAERPISRPTVLAASRDDLVADTLDWRRYFPLSVGNEWHYVESWDSLYDPEVRRTRQHVWRIVSDTLIDNRQYFNMMMTVFEEDTLLSGPNLVHIRYHDEFDHVVVREQEEDMLFEEVPCGLSAPFGHGWHRCAGIDDRVVEFAVGVEHEVELTFGTESVRIPQMKIFGTLVSATYMYSDIGMGSFSAGSWAESYGWGLRFAQVDGRTYGQRVISNEPALPLADGFRVVSIYPNPVANRATIEYSAPSAGPVTIEVFDMLGRKVLEIQPADSGIGTRRLEMDFSGLTAGMYVVRLRSAHHRASALVTRL